MRVQLQPERVRWDLPAPPEVNQQIQGALMQRRAHPPAHREHLEGHVDANAVSPALAEQQREGAAPRAPVCRLDQASARVVAKTTLGALPVVGLEIEPVKKSRDEHRASTRCRTLDARRAHWGSTV